MGYIFYNANPHKKLVGDCTIRAISTVTGLSWDDVYLGIAYTGFEEKDILSSNRVWQSYLNKIGYVRHHIPNLCPYCYTVTDFCFDHPTGRYILGTGDHVIAVIDGNYYDTMDSGLDVPTFYWQKGGVYV